MDKGMSCDFYFGDSVFEPLKQFQPEELQGFRRMFHTVKSGFKDYKWHKGIGCLFHDYKDYLVTGQIDYIANWLLIIYSKLTGRHICCWTHGIKSSEMQKPLSRRIYRLFFKSMSHVFLYNHYSIAMMKELGIKEEKMHVIHNSMDTEQQTLYYRESVESDIYTKHFGNNCPTVIYIGRIQAYKKLDLLIDAIALTNMKASAVNLVIVGAPTDDFSLEDKIAKSGQQNHVWLFGPCFDEKLNAELIYNAKACVCPASVGLTAVHALSYGTPVITNDDFDTQGPEFEAIKDGVTGSFYEADNALSLAKEIEKWTRLDKAERSECRTRARREIESQWSTEYQMNILRNVFTQYLKPTE